jgi:deoxyribonuclease-4
MLLGAHVSIQGGLPKAPERAAEIGCECFQIFTRSPRGGPAGELTGELVRDFRRACDQYEQNAWYIHTPYYINLASTGRRIYPASIKVVREELERGSAIGASAVMTHLGSAGDAPRAEALKRVIAGIKKILSGYRGTTQLLAEIAAGSGGILGDSFEELAVVVKATRGKCGVCFDTQHAFASGYDLRTPTAIGQTFDDFDNVIGLEYLALSHCNDSLTPLGSHKDRHSHIGQGEIGQKGFRAILQEPRLKDIDFILETRTEGVREDLKLLKRFRGKDRR